MKWRRDGRGPNLFVAKCGPLELWSQEGSLIVWWGHAEVKLWHKGMSTMKAHKWMQNRVKEMQRDLNK